MISVFGVFVCVWREGLRSFFRLDSPWTVWRCRLDLGRSVES